MALKLGVVGGCLALTTVGAGVAVQAQDTGRSMGVLRRASEHRFQKLPFLPACATTAVDFGDPAKGPSVLALKAQAGCMIPWHWHSANEHLMVASGTAKLEMRGGPSAVLEAGGYAYLPSKHVHQMSCSATCMVFVSSDRAFDLHYVDANGNEITPEAALGRNREP